MFTKVSPPILYIFLVALSHNFIVSRVGDPVLEDFTSYQKLIGKLLYLTITGPDISFIV